MNDIEQQHKRMLKLYIKRLVIVCGIAAVLATIAVITILALI